MWTPTWIGERLRAEGVITPAQLAATLQAMQLYNERMEEALLRIGAIDEDRLLRFAAERCQTQFVSTAKLSRLQIPDMAMRLLPQRTAEKLLAFPVRYEPATDTLSVVSPDAGDPEYRKQLAIAIRAKHVRAYLARPAAVEAAIAKWYRGENGAFAAVAPDSVFQFGTSLDADAKIHTADQPAAAPQRPAAPEHHNPAPQPRGEFQQPRSEYFVTPLPVVGGEPNRGRPTPPPPQSELPVGVEPMRRPVVVPQEPEPFRHPGRPPSAIPPAVAAPAPAPAPVPAPAPAPAPEPAPRPPSIQLAAAPSSMSQRDERRLNDVAELLNVLVTLNENTRDEFRGHSASVARLSKMMVERMGMGDVDQLHATIAANLHDLGKPVSYHLTLLNVAQYDTHRRAAQKLVYTPQRLVESVGFPIETTSAVSAMYERFDGNGFPGRIAGKTIPLGARVLALCDVYSDLTLNPRNLLRKELSHEEAQKVISQYAGTLFDPDMVELLAQLVVGEDLRRRLSDDKPLVLIVEPDAEEATILELRLVAQGFEVKVTRSADQALKVAEGGNVRYVLSEVELAPFDGFELLQRLRRAEKTAAVPFLFVARSSDAAAVDRAFSLGAQDYVVKPTTGDVLAGKLRRLQAPTQKSDISTGVAGSLKDLALPDLIQILFHGRKGGKLMVKSGGRTGELHFQEGRLAHATIDELAGEEAVFEMLTFADGTFALDPSFQPTTTTIQTSPEMVILEGLRRLDERNR